MLVELLEDAKEMCLASIDWNKRVLGSRAVQRAKTVHSLSQSFTSWERTMGGSDKWLRSSGLPQ